MCVILCGNRTTRIGSKFQSGVRDIKPPFIISLLLNQVNTVQVNNPQLLDLAQQFNWAYLRPRAVY